MESVYKWLFGESKWQQKKKLKKLLCCTAALAVIALILLFDDPSRALFMVAVIVLMWGWGFVRATAATIGKMMEIFGSDVAMLVISLILWFFLGIFGGSVSLVLGIIRFIQLKKE